MTNSQTCNLNAEICLIYLNLSELTIKFRIFWDFQTTFWPITLRLPLWKGVIGLIRRSGKNCELGLFEIDAIYMIEVER